MTITNESLREPETLGLYLHIPFCVRKCNYCGFYSLAQPEEEQLTRFNLNLREEIKLAGAILKEKRRIPRVDTIYFGGGTPSLQSPGMVLGIMDEIQRHFPVAKTPEVTLEANPGTVSLETLKGYRQAGVNRLSIGIQSFDDDILKFLGRIHTAQEGEECIRLAGKTGFHGISLDLMFHLPGQKPSQWEHSLEKAVSFQPEHLSLYALELEEGTPLYKEYQKGSLPELSVDQERATYGKTCDFLEHRGYERYEISNFARPGFWSRHNSKYWKMEEFLGLGPGASSYVLGFRWQNPPDLSLWETSLREKTILEGITKGKREDAKDAAAIFLFTGLRRREGIRFDRFLMKTGIPFEQAYPEGSRLLEEYYNKGWIRFADDGQGFSLTPLGIDHSNELMSEFI